jgi:predicted DCC family thiol-disulfide oxidoreductase YuxK
MNNIILFDGECNFCDHSVQFIIKRDKKAVYKFASIQSDAGQEILKKHSVPLNIDSIILVEDNKCYYKSTAALRICKNLNGGWKLFYRLLIVPKPLRDYFYSIVAKNRYKWFGKKDSCILPSPEIRKRFL